MAPGGSSSAGRPLDAGPARPLFDPRACKHCGRRFSPSYANQQMHPECFPLWRRRYQRLYQRKVRREMQNAGSTLP